MPGYICVLLQSNTVWSTLCDLHAVFYLVQKERRGIELKKKTSVSVYVQTTNRTTHSSLTPAPAESPYRFHIRSNKVAFVWMQWIINWYWNISILFFGCHGYFGLVIIFFLNSPIVDSQSIWIHTYIHTHTHTHTHTHIHTHTHTHTDWADENL